VPGQPDGPGAIHLLTTDGDSVLPVTFANESASASFIVDCDDLLAGFLDASVSTDGITWAVTHTAFTGRVVEWYSLPNPYPDPDYGPWFLPCPLGDPAVDGLVFVCGSITGYSRSAIEVTQPGDYTFWSSASIVTTEAIVVEPNGNQYNGVQYGDLFGGPGEMGSVSLGVRDYELLVGSAGYVVPADADFVWAVWRSGP
jgi:hypothetical protein